MQRKISFVRPLFACAGVLGLGVLLAAGCSDSGKDPDEGNNTPGSGGAGLGGDGSDGTGGGLDVGPGTGGQGGGGSGPMDCGGQAVDAQVTPANLLFVIDRSGSMDIALAGGTRWSAMVAALDGALDHMPEELSVGLQFFPGDDEPASCNVPTSASEIQVPIAPSADNIDTLRAALASTEPNGGNTPAAAALQLAYEYFTDGPGKDLEGKHYVLLALDGGPNCNDDIECEASHCTVNIENECTIPGVDNCCEGIATSCFDGNSTLAKVEQLAAAGVTTLVVGIPGSDDEAVYVPFLDEAAVAGGAPAATSSPKYYRVDDPQALIETMQSLAMQLVTSCALQLEENPPTRNRVNVFIDDEVVPQAGDDGWEYDDSTSPPTIIVKGETCAELEAVGAQSVRIEFGCPTVVVR